MAACLTALRKVGVFAFGVAWLGGEVSGQASLQRVGNLDAAEGDRRLSTGA